jgi:two-component system response regulator WspF
MLGALPLHIAGAIVIVQHVDEHSPAAARGANTPAVPSTWPCPAIAPQANHIYLPAATATSLSTTPAALPWSHRATMHTVLVDVFFFSLAERWRPPGGRAAHRMGEDGAQGLLRLRERGWLTLAQDRESCVVWGMPRAAERLNAAAEVLPPEALGVRLSNTFVTRSDRWKNHAVKVLLIDDHR